MRVFLCGRIVACSMLLLLAPVAIARDSVVIYRCTDARGALTIQNDVACPAGTRQEREVIESPLPPLMPAVATSTPLLSPPAAAPAIATPSPDPTPSELAERGPPPDLFECRTWDDTVYLTDDSVPIERCAPMQTIGIGGAAGIGAGAACEMVVDTCQKVAEEVLCDSWQRRVRDTEAALRFGRYDNRRAAEMEIERVAGIANQSNCAR